MKMWCLDDIGRDSWGWVGLPARGRARSNSPERGGSSSPVETEPPPIVLWLFVVGWLIAMVNYSKRINIVREADLGEFVFR